MLTRIWDFLFHRHRWEDVHKTEIFDLFEDGSRYKIGVAVYQKCRACGAHRKIKLK